MVAMDESTCTTDQSMIVLQFSDYKTDKTEAGNSDRYLAHITVLNRSKG